MAKLSTASVAQNCSRHSVGKAKPSHSSLITLTIGVITPQRSGGCVAAGRLETNA